MIFCCYTKRKRMLDLTIFFPMQGLNCVSPNYMAQQYDINEKMRAILIDWLIEVY